MKFRQRVAWVLVAAYLGMTIAFVYYVFEISERYNTFALDHVQNYHQSGGEISGSHPWSVWGHVSDMPLSLWLLVLLLPYIQVFMMILACTKAEPRLSFAYLWPALLFLKYHQQCRRTPSTVAYMENGQMINGHSIIDT